jgi:outer membrane immunogenic protein
MIAAFGSMANINASAADMSPTPPPYTPPTPIPYTPAAFSWTGFYVGANLGWAWTQISDTVTIGGAGTGTLAGSGSNILGGGQAGFNWQIIEPVVLGMEADFQGTSGGQTITGAAGPAIVNATAKTPYFGTVRGRIGYAYNRFMLYATAGGVFGDNTLTGTVSKIGSFSNSTTYTSWTAGGGIELALGGRFSAKFEYLYIGSPSSSPPILGQTALTQSSHTDLGRAGVNYRF